MTKREFVTKIQNKTGGTYKGADTVLTDICTIIRVALFDGETVTLPGVGTFMVMDVAERYRTNPRTGEKVFVPTHRKIKFRANGTFASAIR